MKAFSIRLVSVHTVNQYTPNDNDALALLYGQTFNKKPNKVYLYRKLKNYRLGICIHLKLKNKRFSNIVIIFQKYNILLENDHYIILDL